MNVHNEQLKLFLADAGLVSKKDFDAVVALSKTNNRSITDLLVSEGYIGEDELRRAFAYITGVPFMSLVGEHIDYATLSLIPEPVARRNNIIAFKTKDNKLEVAMLDIDDLPSIEFVHKSTRLKILPRITDVASIKWALKLYQKELKDSLGGTIAKETESLKEESTEDLQKIAEGSSTVRIVDTLLRHATVQGASDVHIEPQAESLLVRYRIDGILHDAMELPKHATQAVIARVKVLANLRLDEHRLPQDGRFNAESGNERINVRVSCLPTYHGEKIVLRLLRDSVGGFTLESIGFHGIGLDRVHDCLRKTTGMVLSCGPTGAGKSTTLYTLLDIINRPDVNISTIEDPIEYQMPRINQTQVRPEIGFSFANGLRSLVRQDPDVIMVGEIRDKETASLAINAALTGHLVLSTLHTNSAAGAIPRLLDMGVEPFLLASTLRVIIGQRLVRKLDSDRTEYELGREAQDQLAKIINVGQVFKSLKEEKIVAPDAVWKNIKFCHAQELGEKTGYSGRIGIFEVLPISSTIRELVMKRSIEDDIETQAKKEGMLTMSEDGIFKAAQGVTSIEEVLRVIME